MELLVQIKKDRMAARKDQDAIKSKLLTTLVGEADTILKGKQADKYDSIKLIKKFIKGITEIETARGNLTDVEAVEKGILEEYLPVQLSKEETTAIVEALDLTQPIGKLMGALKGEYGDAMNMKLAGKIIREGKAG